ALNELRRLGGGLVVAFEDQVMASLSLPVGGLMCDGNALDVIQAIEEVEKAARDLGTPMTHPFMAMSFLSLSVIPELKITDQGYVDLNRGGLMSFFVDDEDN
ncbi:MAG: adenine deaminase C-terminal domain-containing protein, partial [Synergistales bacterium]|nr:adenine deaminase C-terminal domain-containing protein [Synergistales bacterium]